MVGSRCWSGGVYLNAASAVTYRCLAACCCLSIKRNILPVQIGIWPSCCHCHSLSLASRLVLPFWYRLTRVVPDKGPLNARVCMCLAGAKLSELVASCVPNQPATVAESNMFLAATFLYTESPIHPTKVATKNTLL